jgi:hypothetical protein
MSFASPTHVAAKSAHKPAAAKHVEAKHAEAKPVSAGRKAVPLLVKGRHVPPPVHEKLVAKPVERSHTERSRTERSHLAPNLPAEPARAEPAPEAQEEIHIHHDRHQHFGTETPSTEESRPATRADFLSGDDEEASEPAPEPKSAAPVVRKAAAKPVAVVAEPKPIVVAMQYDKRGHVILPPALKGSHEILLHQNEMADNEGLDRIQDDAGLDVMREAKLIVPIPVVAGLQTNEGLPMNRRYCRPWTAQFLTALARAHYAKFHSALQVNSAVRTVEFQQRLLLTNGNAAPAEGETASPHLTGQAIDLAKRGLSMTEIAWLRGYLLPLVQAGKVDVEEEFQQSCFHISVYKKYLPQPAPPRNIAQTHRSAAAALATAIR